MSEATYSAEHVEQLLRCPVCLERFKQPKILPCQHTFCRSPCLTGLADIRARRLRCPECRSEHHIPLGGVDGFPNNITLTRFLDLARQVAPAVSDESPGTTDPEAGVCAICDSQGQLAMCVHCDKLACENCRRVHADNTKMAVRRQISHLRSAMVPRLRQSISATEVDIDSAKNETEVVRNKVRVAIENAVKCLRDRESRMFAELDNFLQTELRMCNTHRENLEVELASVSSYCDSAESSLTRHPANTAELVDIGRQCSDYAERIQVSTAVPGDRRHARFHCATDALYSSILTFGSVSFGAAVVASSTESASRRISSDLGIIGDSDGDPPFLSPRLTSPPPHGASTTVSADGQQATHQPLDVSWTNSTARPAGRPSGDGIQHRSTGYMFRMSTATDDVHSIVERMRAEERQRRGMQQRPQPSMHTTATTEERTPGFVGTFADSRPMPSNRTNVGRRDVTLSTSTPPATDIANRPQQESNVASNRPPRTVGEANHGSSMNSNGDNPSTTVSDVSSRPGLTRDRTFVRSSATVGTERDIPTIGNQSVSFNINFSSASNPRVSSPESSFRAMGTPVRVIGGRRGAARGCFAYPHGVFSSSVDGTIAIADSGNYRVQIFDASGEFRSMFGTRGQNFGEFERISGIVVTPAGNCIVSDSNNNRIQMFDAEGCFLSAFGEEGSGDGQLSCPWGVAVDDAGFIYVCDKDNNRVQVFCADGTFVRHIAASSLSSPHYVAIDNDNNVVVSDTGNNRLQLFRNTGQRLRTIGEEGSATGMLRAPKGIAVDRHGFIIVADSGNCRIQVFHPDGRALCDFGECGNGEGQFKELQDVAVTLSGTVVVSDRKNHRIQMF